MNLIKRVNVLAKAITRITNVGRGKSEKKPYNEFALVQKKKKKNYSCCSNNKKFGRVCCFK